MSAPLEGPVFSPKRKTPIGLMIALIALGGCGFLFVFFAAVLFPVFAQARSAAQSTRCMSNLRQLGSAVTLYASENDGRFPDPQSWVDELSSQGTRPRSFRCPAVSGFGRTTYGFAFNKDLAGKKVSDFDLNHELIFDSTMLKRNAYSGLETLPLPGRHRVNRTALNHILHVDGSVEARGR
jgi:hypothetical protein